MMHQFVDSVRKMRELQRAYFHTRNRETLIECKQAEKDVDALLAGMGPEFDPVFMQDCGIDEAACGGP